MDHQSPRQRKDEFRPEHHPDLVAEWVVALKHAESVAKRLDPAFHPHTERASLAMVLDALKSRSDLVGLGDRLNSQAQAGATPSDEPNADKLGGRRRRR